MRLVKKFFKIQLLVLSTVVFFISCLDDPYGEKLAEHDRKLDEMKTKYDFTEADTLPGGYDIYIKYSSEADSAIKPTTNDIVIIDYKGIYYSGNVFDVSKRSDAIAAGIEDDEFIYGPGRFRVNNLYAGFQLAFPSIPLGSKVKIILPGNLWNGLWDPVYYEIELHQVIDDIEAYNDTIIPKYLDSLDMTIDDTIPGSDGIWVKDFSNRVPPDTLVFGDTIVLKLYGYYVESDDSYVKNFPGRQFFPISNSGDSIIFLYGAYGSGIFPHTFAVHEAVKYMNIGETIDMVTSAEYGFGEDGFHHPGKGYFIVPEDIPLHYNIELINVMGIND